MTDGPAKTWTGAEIAAISSAEIEATHDAIVQHIRPFLAEVNPIIQGLVLADLVAMFLAGHEPDKRKPLLRMLLATIAGLVPAYASDLDPIRENTP